MQSVYYHEKFAIIAQNSLQIVETDKLNIY
jgi:hypothetical protein